MMVFPTANLLLFIALHTGPANPSMVFATSQSESYVWTAAPTKADPTAWNVTSLGFPTPDGTRNPAQYCTVDHPPEAHSVPDNFRTLSKYNWNHDGIVFFDNGDRVEKRGKYVFYTINAGGPNEKTFTILQPTGDDPESFVEKQEK